MLAYVHDHSREVASKLRIGRRDLGRLALAGVAAVVTGCSVNPGGSTAAVSGIGDPRPARRVSAIPGPGFPRSAVYFLAQRNLPTPQQLARYDLVVIDSEWFGRRGPGFFAELRTHNPEVRLLAYVNVVDYPSQLGDRVNWGDRYALWQYQSSTNSVFPREWLATTASGQLVSEWPDFWMTNLTDAARQFGGRTFAQYAADWVVNQVWPAGVWDGILLDVWGDRVWTADHDAWDYRLDGMDVPDDEIYGPGNPWERGINDAEIIMRANMPDAILVANGTRTMRNGQLNGRVWESFLDTSRGERAGDLETYLTASTDPGIRQPPYTITVNTRDAPVGSAEEYRRARYHLTATLLQDGYWAPMADSDYGELSYYDELDGGGLGRGYLGLPHIGNPNFGLLNAPYADGLGVVAPGVVYRRDFEHGVVLHNSGTTSQTITFEEPLRLLAGTQAPDVNTGQVVESLALGGNDGRILVRP